MKPIQPHEPKKRTGKRKSTNRPPRTAETRPSSEEILKNVQRELFTHAEKIRELMETEGMEVGCILDSMPLFKFRCKMCRSDSVVIHQYEKALCVGCLHCSTVEVIPETEAADGD